MIYALDKKEAGAEWRENSHLAEKSQWSLDDWVKNIGGVECTPRGAEIRVKFVEDGYEEFARFAKGIHCTAGVTYSGQAPVFQHASDVAEPERGEIIRRGRELAAIAGAGLGGVLSMQVRADSIVFKYETQQAKGEASTDFRKGETIAYVCGNTLQEAIREQVRSTPRGTPYTSPDLADVAVQKYPLLRASCVQGLTTEHLRLLLALPYISQTALRKLAKVEPALLQRAISWYPYALERYNNDEKSLLADIATSTGRNDLLRGRQVYLPRDIDSRLRGRFLAIVKIILKNG